MIPSIGCKNQKHTGSMMTLANPPKSNFGFTIRMAACILPIPNVWEILTIEILSIVSHSKRTIIHTSMRNWTLKMSWNFSHWTQKQKNRFYVNPCIIHTHMWCITRFGQVGQRNMFSSKYQRLKRNIQRRFLCCWWMSLGTKNKYHTKELNVNKAFNPSSLNHSKHHASNPFSANHLFSHFSSKYYIRFGSMDEKQRIPRGQASIRCQIHRKSQTKLHGFQRLL